MSNIVEMAKKKRHIYLVQKLQKKSLSPNEIKELYELEEKPLKAGIVRTYREIAEAFGCTKRTVENWKSDGMPVVSDGFYNLIDIAKWKFLKRGKKPEKNTKLFHEINLKKLQAEEKKLKVEEMRGNLISRTDVEKSTISKIMAVKRVHESLPRAIAPVIVGMQDVREVEAFLKDKFREIQLAFSQNPEDYKWSQKSQKKT